MLDASALQQVIRSSLPAAFDTDTEPPGAARLFSPPNHGLALDPDVTLVRGGRGVGKTWWFLSLQNETLRRLAAAEYRIARLAGDIRVHPGYGALLSPDHYPSPSTISRLLNTGGPDAIWQAVCLQALDYPGFSDLNDWAERVSHVIQMPEVFERHLSRVDASSDTEHLVLFDALDRFSQSANETDSLVVSLLKLGIELRTRTRKVRAKIFARPDLVERRLSFPDASKLTANAVDLRWTRANLYGLLFTRMANSPGLLAGQFREWTEDKWAELEPGIWRADRLGGDSEIQAAVFTRLAGPYMGTNHRRGRTYPWLPDHLADGRGETSPRSFLSALAAAVEHAQSERAGHSLALHFDSIKSGVQRASQIRVAEISEDVPWVRTAISELHQMSVPVERQEVVARWKASPNLPAAMTTPATSDEEVRVGPRDATDFDALIVSLVELGVMAVRNDGRLDVPDVYRIAFGIGRKGGVPRLANR